MKKIFMIFAMLGLMLSLSAITFASVGTGTQTINNRQRNQQQRIRRGYRNGSLSGREAVRLQIEQARIRNKERRAKADGVVSLRERARLQRDLNRSSRHIRNKRHN